MYRKTFRPLSALLLLAVILSACGLGAQAQPTATSDPNAVYTAAAQTADARLTQIALYTPSPSPVTPTTTPNLTQTAAVGTAAAVLTQAAAVTLTPRATSTSAPPPTASSADRAAFVADVTVPDGTDFAPGATFVKTWRLQNNGTTTWSTSYDLAFISGDQMGTTASTPITQSVPPGTSIDVSVTLTAPSSTGTYRGYWKMVNAAGAFFNDSVYVEIDVVAGGTPAASVTPSSSVTPGPTATQSGNPITSLSMAVDPPAYIGACPKEFSFAATFTLSQAATLTYVLEGYSGTPGFTFNLPPAQTTAFGAGTYTLSFPLTFSSTGSGYVVLHITAPVNMLSNQAAFTLTCQ